jgi:ADP-heptose:LPS heptosyltransferase
MRKILVIRFSSIGDIVLTTPVIRTLKQQLDAEVHFLTKKTYAPVLRYNPYVDRLWLMERDVSELIPGLRAERFDHIVDLHRNLRSKTVELGLFPISVSAFDKLNFRKWLLTTLKIDRMPDRHIVDRYLAAAAPLGVENDGQGLDYFLGPEDEVRLLPQGEITEQDVSLLVAAGEIGIAATATGAPLPYVAFVIGAAHATKRLPEEQITQIAAGISEPVVLLGGPGESAAGERIARAAGPHVLNTCGALSLNQSACLVRDARRVLTHDTGLMHIAAAFRKRIISVWGNTVPAFGMYPYYPAGMDRNTTLEVRDLSCRPCSKIGYAECPKGHFRCMRDIHPERVIAAVTAAE